MNITIIGGGKVGYTIAENLANENHDITVIETDDNAIGKINEELDVLSIKGNGASISALRSANIDRADVLIATTGRDELNMIACLAGKNLGADYTIARIRDYDYESEVDLLQGELKIDMVINPENATALQISRLMRFSAAADIETFYNGRVELVGFKVRENDNIVGRPLSEIRTRQSAGDILICSVEHGGETVIPNGSTVIHDGDRVFIIGTTKAISRFFKDMGRNTQRIKNVLIIGGGRIGANLTKKLLDIGMKVKIIEKDYDRCVTLSELCPGAEIINADGTDQTLLDLESASDYDCLITLTGRDEDNILTCLYAKHIGIKRTIAKLNHQNYSSMVDSLDIDSTVSPKLITAYGIIRTVRGLSNSQGSKMISLYKIAGGNAEAMEFAVSKGTKNIGIPLKSLQIKQGILLAVIMRDRKIIIPQGNDTIEIGDGLIIVSKDHRISDINDIFTI